jgi:hypothetical protein
MTSDPDEELAIEMASTRYLGSDQYSTGDGSTWECGRCSDSSTSASTPPCGACEGIGGGNISDCSTVPFYGSSAYTAPTGGCHGNYTYSGLGGASSLGVSIGTGSGGGCCQGHCGGASSAGVGSSGGGF